MNPWLMGILAAAVSAVAGATSWLDLERSSNVVESERGALREAAREATIGPEELWRDRRPPPSLTVLHPLAALDDEAVFDLVSSDLEALGSMSVGSPSGGALVNGVQFPRSPMWRLADAENAWGTSESVEFVKHAIERVNERFPDTPVLYVGDFSAQKGGRLRPHVSHQSGRDVDLGFYYTNGSAWYRPADASNLDRARTWALVHTLITETRVQYIFLDQSLQPLLEQYALARGEDPQWLRRVFHGTPGRKDSVIRHRWGHATHLHVRFENPTAELTARRAYEGMKLARVLPNLDYYPKPKRARRSR